MKKIVCIIIAIMMLGMIFASCGKEPEKELLGLSEPILSAPTFEKDFEIPADFKIGLICLHDENSTYDANFIRCLKNVQTVLGLSDE
jgi:basic membrane protein A